MSKIIMLKSLTDTINIKKFKYKDKFIETFKITEDFNKFLNLNINAKNIFKRIFNKIKNRYYKYIIVHELSYIITEDTSIILSKNLKHYINRIQEVLDCLDKKYKLNTKILDQKVDITKLLYKYIENIDNIYLKSVAVITKDINKLNKKMYLQISQIAKKVDIIYSNEIFKENRMYKYVESINNEYGMCNEIKNTNDLKDYLVVVNLDKDIDNLQLFKYNNHSIYIDCFNIFSNKHYDYLISHSIENYIDKENMNILKYMKILENENLNKNISFIYNEKDIYISELLNALE